MPLCKFIALYVALSHPWNLLLNARLTCNNACFIHELITDDRTGLVYITKTWSFSKILFSGMASGMTSGQRWGSDNDYLWHSYWIAACLPELLDVVAGLAAEFSRLMKLGYFNLPSLDTEWELVWKFMATRATIELTQDIKILTYMEATYQNPDWKSEKT